MDKLATNLKIKRTQYMRFAVLKRGDKFAGVLLILAVTIFIPFWSLWLSTFEADEVKDFKVILISFCALISTFLLSLLIVLLEERLSGKKFQ